MKAFSVVFTSYKDDYKHRYDNGVYPDDPVLFEDENDAREYASNEIYENLDDIFDCKSITEIIIDDLVLKEEEAKENNNDDDDDNSLLKKLEPYKNNLNIMEKIRLKYCKGEFIDYKFDVAISECEVRPKSIK